MTQGSCAHIETIKTIKHAKRRECEDCVKSGSSWVHLRICQECGGTRCCDDSPNRHATQHARASNPGNRFRRIRRALALLLPGRGIRGILGHNDLHSAPADLTVTETDAIVLRGEVEKT